MNNNRPYILYTGDLVASKTNMSLPNQTSKLLEQKLSKSQVAAAQVFNPSTLEAEVEGFL